LGHHEPAIKLIHGGIDAADKGGNQGYRLRARVTLARALQRAGRADEVQRPLDEALAMMMSNEAAHHAWLIEAAIIQAELHRGHGRLDLAQKESESALRRIGYPEKRHGYGLPQVLLSLARVQRARGRYAPALESARIAVELFEHNALDPRQSADVGEALLELAQVQFATGDAAAAAKSMERALPSLRNGLGPDHELTRQSEQLAHGSR
jgi:tetratricopeptide (TPR) repeat protein